MVMIAFFRGLKSREGKTSRFLRGWLTLFSRFRKTRNKKNAGGVTGEPFFDSQGTASETFRLTEAINASINILCPTIW